MTTQHTSAKYFKQSIDKLAGVVYNSKNIFAREEARLRVILFLRGKSHLVLAPNIKINGKEKVSLGKHFGLKVKEVLK